MRLTASKFAFAISLAALQAPVLVHANPQSDNTASSANNASNPSDANGKTHAQKMKDCIAQQKATNSSSMSDSAIRTLCKNQVNKQGSMKNGNDLSSGPQGQMPPQQ